ncbi:MAG: cyclopropane-fatty-acyl-phospholipid synthase family protein [Caulobacteraceae bacterium]
MTSAIALQNAPASVRTTFRLAAQHWAAGQLTVQLPSGETFPIEGALPGPGATLILRDYAFMRRVLAGGDIGFAESFMAGEWDTPDLAALLEVFSLNYDRLARLMAGSPMVRAVNAVTHLFRRNSRGQARRNIHAHYDLGNAFYSTWLDPSMTYSSALFDAPGLTLEQAQQEKYAALARAIGAGPGSRLLEIGCGWGGFAEFAAREVGAHVTGVTISPAQHEFARRRLFEQGLADRADIRLIDYRDVEGRFDGVVSIEMFEAVGEAYWPRYFDKVRDVLEPGGRAGLQIITIRDDLFEGYRARPDFIQKYIFPGGMLPGEGRLRAEVAQAGLAWGSVLKFGQDYADTLKAWAARFEAAWGEISSQGFDEKFRRLWTYYLRYCEAGFRTGRTDVIQLSLHKA